METIDIECPHCGEINTIQVEWGTHGSMIEDCFVCCRSIEIAVSWDEWGDPVLIASQADG